MKSAFLVIAIAAVCSPALAQKSSMADRAWFQSMYRKVGKAFEMKDVAAISAGMTDDFTETLMGATSNKQQSQEGITQFLGLFKTLRCKFKMTGMKVSGNMATTMDTVHCWGMSAMADAKTKRPFMVDAVRDETMSWVKVGGKWMLKKLVAKNEKMMKNGKPWNMGPNG